MPLYNSSGDYLYNLQACSSAEAKRMWRNEIKEKWNHECAYCGSNDELTLDHIIPLAKGGVDYTHNVLCSCRKCNSDKGHTPWRDWYGGQEFFSYERMEKIEEWIRPPRPSNLYTYRQRRNNAS
jgi:hypothetical protein